MYMWGMLLLFSWNCIRTELLWDYLHSLLSALPIHEVQSSEVALCLFPTSLYVRIERVALPWDRKEKTYKTLRCFKPSKARLPIFVRSLFPFRLLIQVSLVKNDLQEYIPKYLQLVNVRTVERVVFNELYRIEIQVPSLI